MSGHNGFSVDLQALQAASDGVQAAVDELNGMSGWGSGSTNQGADGQGLTDGILAALQDIGHDGLQQALDEFRQRWDWGVQMLVDEAVSTTDALMDTRSTYQQAEDAVVGFLKETAQWALDPMADGNASEQSWAELSQDTLEDTARGYSSEGFDDAGHKAGRTFQALSGLGDGGGQ